MPHRLAGALQERTGAKRCWNEEPFEEIELFRRERCLAFEVRPQRIKCRHGQPMLGAYPPPASKYTQLPGRRNEKSTIPFPRSFKHAMGATHAHP